ncbi:MAG: hypothetical protein OXC19_01820 [Bryobacterales bacterium]|nr:hypothetical protein [Bryobacterales bacterium]
MRKIWTVAIVACAMAGTTYANDQGGHAYKKTATVQKLMEYMVKPAMAKIKEYREAGGPANKEEWQAAHGAISMVTEATQLTLMDGRIKDEAWSDGATAVIEAAQGAMLGAYRMDADGYNKGLKAMSAACKTCHDVHKKEKE